jgi:tetratricopeptide (TPR) repeat protein
MKSYTSAGLFLLALALRLLHLLEARHSPYFGDLYLDAEEYQTLANGLLSGQWGQAAADTYVHGILFPALWALVMFLGGGSMTMRLVQAVLGAATCVLLHRGARHVMPPHAALVCGLLAALYWPFILFGGQLLATTLVLFLVAALLALLLRPGATAPGRVLGAGVLLALLATTRANSLLLTLPVLWWLRRQTLLEEKRTFWRSGALLGAGLLLGLAPFVAHNWSTQGTPMPFEGAWSFYMGNNPDADGTPYARQGLDWQRLESVGYRHGWDATPAERGLVYLSEGMGFLVEEPGRAVGLLWRKLRLFWNAFEVPVSVDLAWYTHNTWLGRLLPGFGLLAPLAVLGMVANLRRWHGWGLAYGGVLAFLVSGLLFTVCARYRLPAVPFLILFAAGTVRLFAAALSSRGHRAARLGIGLGLGLAVAAAWVHTGVDAAAVDHLRPHWLQGSMHLRRGEVHEGVADLRAAAEDHPGDAEVRNSLAVALERLDRPSEAEAVYREALRLAPDHAKAWLNLGDLQRRQRRLVEAAESVRQALVVDPRPVTQYKGRVDLAQILLQTGHSEEAMAILLEALQVRDGRDLRYALASACHQLERFDEELDHLEQAVQLDPSFAPAWRNLGASHLGRGNLAAAERALMQAATLEPASPVVHRHLGALYQRTGRQKLAGEAFARARRLD